MLGWVATGLLLVASGLAPAVRAHVAVPVDGEAAERAQREAAVARTAGAITSGARVELRLEDGSVVVGPLRRVTPGALLVGDGPGGEWVPTVQVTRLAVHRGATGKGALLGGALGLGAGGALVSLAAGLSGNDEVGSGPGFLDGLALTSLPTLLGVGVGALVGAMVPRWWEERHPMDSRSPFATLSLRALTGSVRQAESRFFGRGTGRMSAGGTGGTLLADFGEHFSLGPEFLFLTPGGDTTLTHVGAVTRLSVPLGSVRPYAVLGIGLVHWSPVDGYVPRSAGVGAQWQPGGIPVAFELEGRWYADDEFSMLTGAAGIAFRW